MKHVHRFSIVLFLLFISVYTESTLNAQFQRRSRSQYRVTGWVDDTHFIFQTLNADKQPVTLSIDVRSGKGVPYTEPKSNRDILRESLPEGVTLGFSDIVKCLDQGRCFA